MNNSLYQKAGFWQLLSVVLLIPAIFSHLGLLPLDTGSDEPRRALVALEMILSGDYITPTLNGEPYFNKPPLYNWLIALSFRAFGDYSSFALRFPMAVSLVLFGVTIFGLVRKELSNKVAFAAALMLVTNTRILLYDSMLGLIDIAFSWVTYTAFILVYQLDRKKNYWALFLITYFLTAVGYMMKGLPSLVFQGLTLGAYFLYTRQFRRLFHPAHFVGVALLFGLLGLYYVTYFTQNNIPPEKIAAVLFDESAKRTVVKFGIAETLLHLLTFPFEMLYLYAPWMLMIVFLIGNKGFSVRKMASLHPFVCFNAIIFIVNFVIYWSSPQVYARYLFMMLPLLFTIFAYYYYESRPTDWQRKAWDMLLGGALTIVTIGCWTPFFMPETKNMPDLWWQVPLIFVFLLFMTWQYWRQTDNRLVILIAFLGVVRIGFNWFVLPPRIEHRQFYKDSSEQMAKLTIAPDGRPLPLFSYKNTVGNDGATDVNSFHIEALRGEVLKRTERKIPGVFYIADSLTLVGEDYKIIHEFMLFDQHPAKLVQFK